MISVVFKKRKLLLAQQLALFLFVILFSNAHALSSRYSHVKSRKQVHSAILANTSISSEKSTCAVDLDDDVRFAHQRYLDAINISNRYIDLKTNAAVSLVIADGQDVFLYTKKNIDFDGIKNVFGDQVKSKGECSITGGNSDGIKIFIFNANISEESSIDRHFEFVYPQNQDDNSYKQKLSVHLGKYLFVNRISSSELGFDEASRTIVHEAMHLFGQDRLILMEPEFDHEISSRYYLENLIKINPQFQDEIRSQICYSLDVLKLRLKNKDAAYKKKQSAFLLSKLLKLNRSIKVNYGIGEIENYWYLLEGIPEYYDHQVLVKHSPDRLLDIYRVSCEQRDNNLNYFYPNLIGAAIFHGYEMLGSPVKPEFNLFSEFKDIKAWSFRLDSYIIKDKTSKKLRLPGLKKRIKKRR